MYNATARIKANNVTTATVQLDSELSKVGISAMVIVAGLVSVWAMACMFGGMVESGGPLALIQSWFGAVIGV